MLCPSARLLASALDASPDAALLLDADTGTVLHSNAPARVLFLTDDLDGSSPPFPFPSSSSSSSSDDGGDVVRSNLSSLVIPEDGGQTWEGMVAPTPSDGGGGGGGDAVGGGSSAPVLPRDATAVRVDGATVGPVSLRLKRIGPCRCCSDGAPYACAYVRSRAAAAAAAPTPTPTPPPPSPRRVRFEGVGEEEWHRMKRLRATVDAAFDPMFSIDVNGTILMANAAASDQFGWTFGEFVGSNVSMICGGGHADRHDEYIRGYLSTGVTKIMGKRREVPARRKDGTEFPVELGIREIRNPAAFREDGGDERIFCAFVRDLSDQKRHEMEAQSRESLTQGMVDSSFDPMFQIDERGIIRVVNRAAQGLFGWTREQFLGRNVSMICGGEHGDRHDGYIARYLASDVKRVIGRRREVLARRKDGMEFTVELGVSEVRSHSGRRMFCGYIRDLTRQNLDKEKIRQKEALIQGEFFQGKSSPRRGGRRLRHSPTI